MDQAHDDGPTARLPVADSTVSVSPEAAPRFSPGAGPEDSPQANPQPSPAPRPLPETARRVLVMAIVNRTRDSFFDEGRTWDLEAAVDAGLAAGRAGADLVDIGGVKFAPGAPVPAAEGCDRVVAVVAGLRGRLA